MEPAACHQRASLPQRGTTAESAAASTAGCMSSYSGCSPSTRTQSLLPASSLQTSLSPSHCEPVALLEHQLAALWRGRQQQPLHSMVCDPAALIMLRRCTHSSSSRRRPDLEVCRCCLVQQQQAGSFHKLPQVRGRARGVGPEAAHQGIRVGRKLLSALHCQHRIRLQDDARRCEDRHVVGFKRCSKVLRAGDQCLCCLDREQDCVASPHGCVRRAQPICWVTWRQGCPVVDERAAMLAHSNSPSRWTASAAAASGTESGHATAGESLVRRALALL